MFNRLRKLVKEIDQLYQTHQSQLHGVLGIGLGILILLYCYGKWKTPATTSETHDSETPNE